MNRWQKIFVTHPVCKSIKSGSLEPKHRNEEGLEAFAQQRIKKKKVNCLKNKKIKKSNIYCSFMKKKQE